MQGHFYCLSIYICKYHTYLRRLTHYLLILYPLRKIPYRRVPDPGATLVTDAVWTQVSQNRLLRAKKMFKIFSLNMGYITWDRPLGVSFSVQIGSTGTQPFKFMFISPFSKQHGMWHYRVGIVIGRVPVKIFQRKSHIRFAYFW